MGLYTAHSEVKGLSTNSVGEKEQPNLPIIIFTKGNYSYASTQAHTVHTKRTPNAVVRSATIEIIVTPLLSLAECF